MATKGKPESDWSSLPSLLLTLIAKRLPTRVDVLRYRAVCRNFRSSVTLSAEPRYPYPNIKIPATVLPEADPGHLTLKQHSFYAVEQVRENSRTNRRLKTRTWVLRVEELGYGIAFVKKPFCGDDYRNLHKKLPKGLNLLDYRVKETSKIYELDFIPDKYSFYDTKFRRSKVVVSDDVSSVMTSFRGELVVWRIGDEDWTEIDVSISSGFGVCFEDYVYHKEKFYAVHTENLFISVDFKSLEVAEIGFLEIPFVHDKCFLTWLNHLYLIVKFFGPNHADKIFKRSRKNRSVCGEDFPFGFLILKFNEEKLEFSPAPNAFEEGVVFLGDDFSFSVSAAEFPGLKKNCIYLDDGVFGFDDDIRFDGDDDIHPGLSVGMFDLAKNIARPLSDAGNIFWAPPTWLKPCS